LVPWNKFFGSLKVKKIRALCLPHKEKKDLGSGKGGIQYSNYAALADAEGDRGNDNDKSVALSLQAKFVKM
jgi:hypothetical protein